MSNSPFIIIASKSIELSESLIKNICQVDTPETKYYDEDINYYRWIVDNKYYTANLNVVPVNEPSAIPSAVHHEIEAFLLHSPVDVKQLDDEYEKWKPLLESTSPEIRILVYDYEPKPGNEKRTHLIQEWCLRNHFELVNFHDNVNENNDNAFDRLEAQGFERIVEALHAHTWSNLTMKTKSPSQPRNQTSLSDDTDDISGFCTLFAQLQSMKDGVQSLPVNQRRECAEQVVKAFWQAIGGDESEIEDIID